MSKPFLTPGPIPTTAIASPGELDAIVSSAQPAAFVGFIWCSATAPDTTTYPQFKLFVWADTTDIENPILKTWRESTSSWEASTPADGSITGAMIALNTIPLNRIYVPAGQNGYVVRVGPSTNELIFDAPANLFPANSLSAQSIVYGPPATSSVFCSTGSANGWVPYATFMASAEINISQLRFGAADAAPRVIGVAGAATVATLGSANSFIANNTIDITKLNPGTGNNSRAVKVNAAGNAMEFVGDAFSFKKFVSAGTDTVPAAGAALTWAHGMALSPTVVEIWLVCNSADAGYNPTKRINAAYLFSANGFTSDDQGTPFTLMVDDTNIKFIQNLSGWPIYVATGPDSGTLGTVVAINQAKWNVLAIAYSF
jgi:hypothetical protein